MYEEDHSWSFAIGLFVGALVGAAAASLFTPRSGAQNRELVREKGLVLKDRVSDAATSATSKASDVASNVNDTVKSATSSAAERASAVAATVTETASSTVSSVQEVASKATSTVTDTASTVATRVSGATATVTERARELKDQVATTASGTVGTVREKVSGATDAAAGNATELQAQASNTLQKVQDTDEDNSVITTDSIGVSDEGLASSIRPQETDIIITDDIVIADTSPTTGETVRLPRSEADDSKRSGNSYSDLTTSGTGGDVPGSSGPGSV
jgi:gas vesicle protein